MENFSLIAHVADSNSNQTNHLHVDGTFENIEQQLKGLAALANSENGIVGIISFYAEDGKIGEVMEYTSSESYLNALRNELDSNIGGFKYQTLMNNPELLKKVDDLVYGSHGVDNPNSLTSYVEKVQKETAKEKKDKKKLHFTITNENGKRLLANIYPIELSGNLIDLKRFYKVPIGTDELWEEQKKWERELSTRTELSDGLTNTGIDEKHAHFFRIYNEANLIELEEKEDFFLEIDLFNNYEFIPEDLKPIVDYWSEKIESGEDNGYSYCDKFQKECQAHGYTFEYDLTAEPFFLRPINIQEQLILEQSINTNYKSQNMENTENPKGKEQLIQVLNAYYQNEENPEPMWDFNHSAGQKILDFCIETQNKEEVFEAVLNFYTVIGDPIVEPDVRDYDLEVLGDEELYNKHVASYNIKSAEFEIAYNNAINELNRLGISEIDLPIDGDREIEAIRTLKKDLDTQFVHLVPAVYNDIFENKNKSVVLEIGKLAIVNHEADYFKGQIVNINDDRVVLKSLEGLEKNFHKDEIYQFFPGQKYDRSEIEALFKIKPAGINFSDLDKSDITRLMRGELTNSLFKGISDKDGKKVEYSFKMRPEYSKAEKKLTLKPHFKNNQSEIPTKVFGVELNEEQKMIATQGKSLIIDGISKDEKPFSVKVHYDQELNSFIADKFIKKTETTKVEEEIKQKYKGPKI
ncbi:hypothetical protein [Chryseobacterium oncorhynchi]|uniref:DUF3945 domain-containing protein n=1 Tax=Chryseobacterium oncorhynchi TaxID=741074 RepID=A0A316WH69_9FLAO|nr:hypothetical protein [Chryseobacterium oncorhynchi]PWN59566.1 hypothetical protein C1638_021425 [Chryseobacterium oncorhynchi]